MSDELRWTPIDASMPELGEDAIVGPYRLRVTATGAHIRDSREGPGWLTCTVEGTNAARKATACTMLRKLIDNEIRKLEQLRERV